MLTSCVPKQRNINFLRRQDTILVRNLFKKKLTSEHFQLSGPDFDKNMLIWKHTVADKIRTTFYPL